MTDEELIHRLRDIIGWSRDDGGPSMMQEAADRLAALLSERDRLRAALEPFACVSIPDNIGGTVSIMPRFVLHPQGELDSLNSQSFRRARAVLSSTQE